MEDSKQSTGDELAATPLNASGQKNKAKDKAGKDFASSESIAKKPAFKSKAKQTKLKNKKNSKDLDDGRDEYNFAGIKYKTPGKKQTIVVASVVLGLNLALALGVLLYLKNPGFKELIYNIGR